MTDRRCTKEKESKCNPDYIVNPKLEAYYTINSPLTNVVKGVSTSSQDNIVQVAPQNVNIKLRPSKFKFLYSPVCAGLKVWGSAGNVYFLSSLDSNVLLKYYFT